MPNRILLTGATGFIGGHVLHRLQTEHRDHCITALVRPGTADQRIRDWAGSVERIPIDLADIGGLKKFLETNSFDLIYHIGALRGGRPYKRETFYQTNVMSTGQLVESALKHDSRFIFCSSVGVFGTIPAELPANNLTQKVPDSYYHYTKIEAEKLINHGILRGLHAAILRPAITYGTGDYGFPYQMVRMVDKHQFALLMKRRWIHLCHVDTITDAFLWLLDGNYESGLTLNVADREPVQLAELINFISRELHAANYPKRMIFDEKIFRLGELVSKWMKSEKWLSRFQLISRSWFFDVQEVYDIMSLTVRYTIPDFRVVIKDYRK